MALVSSVPKVQFTAAGVVLPTEEAILAGVVADIDAAFGGGLNPALETPQGQLASSQSAVIADKNSQIALISNQVDPQYASGRWQDAIGRIYFLNRRPATFTSVLCQLGGLPGTVIPAGSFAQDTNNNTYVLANTVTIGPSSTVDATFANIVSGPIPCAANTLTSIYQVVIGWDTINNASAGISGSNVESRTDFEFRRRNSVAVNANGSVGSIYGNVFKVDNVLDCYVVDNFENTTVTFGATNYPIAAHSIYVGVVGGLDEDIGRAVWEKKDVGCGMVGNTTVTVKDTSGYSYPEPEYTITFNRPTPLPIKFAISVVNNPSLPANITQLIKQSVIDKFNGTSGLGRERIGSNILVSGYYPAVAGVSNVLNVLSILIGTVTATLTVVSVGIDQSPTIDELDIVITYV